MQKHSGGVSYYVGDPDQQIYLVLVVHDRPRPFPTRVDVMAHIVNDWVVIDEDTTDRPLVDQLVERGIPRDRIVRLYAGDSLPPTIR
jgi:hypothetical protein